MASVRYFISITVIVFTVQLGTAYAAVAETTAGAIVRAAEMGNEGAQLELALMYLRGNVRRFDDGSSISTDLAKSVDWFERLAKEGSRPSRQVAAFELGKLYTGAEGFPVNLAKAEHWFRICANLLFDEEPASKQMSAEALSFLGQIYLEKCLWLDLTEPICDIPSTLPLKSYGTAARYFQQSAKLGNENAKIHLALLYIQGKGVPQNFDGAYELLLEMAEGGNDGTIGNESIYVSLGKLCQMLGRHIDALMWFTLGAAEGQNEAVVLRDGAILLLSPSEIELAQQLAEVWFRENRL